MNLQYNQYTLELLTPCWAGGANPDGEPEIRVPTIRGQLRWWLRALYPKKRYDSLIFGRTGSDGSPSASKVTLRLTSVSALQKTQNLEDYTVKHGTAALSEPEAYFLWPLRPTGLSDQKRGVFFPARGQAHAQFTFEIAALKKFPESEQKALNDCIAVWSLLGTLGTRGTRGYGSLWPADSPTASVGEFKERLGVLPPTIRVRLLNDTASSGRGALAAAATWFRSLRAGSSKSGITPSKKGLHDHDVGATILSGSALHPNTEIYRPVLGLPLVQRFIGQGSVRTTWNNKDRYPSPVHIKICKIGKSYRVAVVIFDDYLMPSGTKVKLNGKEVPISRELIVEIASTGDKIH